MARDERATTGDAEILARSRARAKRILDDLERVNPAQAALVRDPSQHSSGLCPRRAGKTHAAVAAVLVTGEAKPGSICIIISLNLKQLYRLYWEGAPAGIHAFDKKYGLKLHTNTNQLRWEHENGSIGYLLGADDDDQLEVIRGMEADLYIVDECKSFAPSRLDKLIDEIIDPQRATRQGRLILIGTPGHILAGPFYQATCADAHDPEDPEKRPYLIPAGKAKDKWGRTATGDLLWSAHSWTLKDNSAKPHQWAEALVKKKSKRWSDDHPIWRRESLGQWTAGGEGAVFRYGELLPLGNVSWVPQPTKDNPAGLPAEGAPWRFIAGLDFGYEAPTAFVLAAYSSKLGELRHVWDYSAPHMLVPDIADLVESAQDRFGTIERIFADAGSLGRMVVETLKRTYGLPIERAEKREKYDYIELLNGALSRGEVKVIGAGKLHEQLLTVAWDLRDDMTKEEMARQGRLFEDKNIPNDSSDAFVYLFRGSLHQFGSRTPEEAPPAVGSPEAVDLWEKAQLKAARAEFAKPRQRFTEIHAPRFIRKALKTSWRIPTANLN